MNTDAVSQPRAGTSIAQPNHLITDQLAGTWFITHTTSPVWKDKRNVVLTYTVLSGATNGERPRLDDLISYQDLTSLKLRTMRGTDTPSSASPRSWTWRGNGWLKFVTSHWEVVHHCHLLDDQREDGFIVVFAQKSLFTPAVLNICTQSKAALDDDRLEKVKMAVKELGFEELETLTEELYCVKHE